MHELALFAGAGGGILGGALLGWRTVCAVEIDAYCRAVLLARQRDGLLPPFAIWDDVRTFDGRPWRGHVDVVSGGFPCQDISAAGGGAGIDGERSGLWVEMARIIDEVRPRFAFVENSPMLTSRGLGRVLGDLAAMGFDARWGVLGAADIGAPHKRERIWIVGDAVRNGRETNNGRKSIPDEKRDCSTSSAGREEQQPWTIHAGLVADAHGARQLQPQGREFDQRGRPGDCGAAMADTPRLRPEKPGKYAERQYPAAPGHREANLAVDGGERPVGWWDAEPDVGRVAHGVAARVDRLRALGNGQIPGVAATAWRMLTR